MTSSASENGGVRPRTAPAVSLVLPVYNGETYLAEALGSILSQSFEDFELIAVDDCSTDSTPHILAKYAGQDARLRVIRNAANMKLPASLNIGFGHARGEWYSWTSDDNILLPGALATLMAARRANPSADILHADYRIIGEDGAKAHRVVTGPASELPVINTIGCCFIYRAAVDERLRGYDESLFGVEDYDFWLRARKAGFAFHHVSEELYLYRRHAGSLTDRRARQINTLLHDRLLPEAESLPTRRERARARIMMATRDPYTMRPRHLAAAFRESPPAVIRHGGDILRWLRLSAAVRLRGGVT